MLLVKILSFHLCTMTYQNVRWSYKNCVKLCGFTIELRRKGIAHTEPLSASFSVRIAFCLRF